jgi:hypothetical protein
MVLYITFISIVNISISNEPIVGIFVSVCFTASHRTGCVHYIFVCYDAAVLLTTRNFSSLFFLEVVSNGSRFHVRRSLLQTGTG